MIRELQFMHLGACDKPKTWGPQVEIDPGCLIVNPHFIEFDGPARIRAGTYLIGDSRGFIHFSSGVYIGYQCIINGAGGVYLGKDCALGDKVEIITSVHNLNDKPEILLSKVNFSCVSIGRGADVGVGSVILPGVNVGRFTQIGAGSVVTRSIPDNSIAVGNPCRVTKERTYKNESL